MQEELGKLTEKSTSEAGSFDFIREEIKARPINRKKVLRNTLLSAGSAVVFGLVACAVFALLLPLFTRLIRTDKPEEVKEPITFDVGTVYEEMNPEDMLVKALEPETEIDLSKYDFLEEEQIKELISSVKFSLADYQDLYRTLAAIADEASKSLVKVSASAGESDWLNNYFETTIEEAGVIAAEDASNIYLIAEIPSSKEQITVTFYNGIQARATIIMEDDQTGLCALSVPLNSINNATKNAIKTATFGSSSTKSVVGAPVIAIGSPLGNYNSVDYGVVTSNTSYAYVPDGYYRVVTTDIYGSQKASGVLINLTGNVIGIISSKFSTSEMSNIVSAIGISELKSTLENLINARNIGYLGVKGADVPKELKSENKAPDGAYIFEVELDSPAMNAGIQSGDIITSVGKVSTLNMFYLVSALKNLSPDTNVTVTVYRSVQGVYREIKFDITLGAKY